MTQLNDLRTLPFQQGGRVIYLGEDDYGRILVIDDGRRRILNFDSLFEQSCMQLSHPHQLVHHHTRLMALAVAFVDPVHTTLLGLGGGSLLRTLHHALPESTFHAIELRQAVVSIAEEYFLLPRDHRVRITVDDAVAQISAMESNSSDIIFADMYDAYRMAPGQTRRGFLLECMRVLTKQGFLVINLHRHSTDRPAFFATLRSIFPTVMLTTTTENCVIFASKTHPGQVEMNVPRIENLEDRLRQRLSRLLARVQTLDVSCMP